MTAGWLPTPAPTPSARSLTPSARPPKPDARPSRSEPQAAEARRLEEQADGTALPSPPAPSTRVSSARPTASTPTSAPTTRATVSTGTTPPAGSGVARRGARRSPTTTTRTTSPTPRPVRVAHRRRGHTLAAGEGTDLGVPRTSRPMHTSRPVVVRVRGARGHRGHRGLAPWPSGYRDCTGSVPYERRTAVSDQSPSHIDDTSGQVPAPPVAMRTSRSRSRCRPWPSAPTCWLTAAPRSTTPATPRPGRPRPASGLDDATGDDDAADEGLDVDLAPHLPRERTRTRSGRAGEHRHQGQGE